MPSESFTEDKETYFTEESQDPRHPHPHTQTDRGKRLKLERATQMFIHSLLTVIINDFLRLINCLTYSLTKGGQLINC